MIIKTNYDLLSYSATPNLLVVPDIILSAMLSVSGNYYSLGFRAHSVCLTVFFSGQE